MKRFKALQIFLAFMMLSLSVVIAGCGSNGQTGHWLPARSLMSIQVTPPTRSIANLTTQQFMATGIYSDNTTVDLTSSVTWTSSNTGVATISNASGLNGLATGVTPGGPITITATDPSTGLTGTATLTVTMAALVSIQVTPANPSIANGTTQQFIATGIYADFTTQNLTSSVTWTSSNTGVATISNTAGLNGLATSSTVGVTTITATSGLISGHTTLTVTAATLVSIVVTPANPSIANGTTQQFIATGIFTAGPAQNLTTSVTWTSSNTGVATISNAVGFNGLATSLSVGGTTITATLGLISGNTTLTVTAATLVSIAVTPANPSIARGTNQQFLATGTFTSGPTQDLTSSVTWTSSNTGVATISNAVGSKGLATSSTVGTTTITATAGAVSGNTLLTVTAATLVSIAVTPANPSIYVGDTQQYLATGTFTAGPTQNLTTSVTWTTTPLVSTVATISNAAGFNGLATGLTVGGPITITATDPSTLVAGTALLTVMAGTPVSCTGPGPLDLGAAASFGVLVGPAGGATLSVTNPTSVTGDVGASSYVPAGGPSTVTGTKYTGVDAPYVAAQSAMLVAVGCAQARTCDFSYATSHDFGGNTLAPGVYCVTGGMSVGSNLTITTPGVYVFLSTGALTSANNITVQLSGAANATNTSIFWVPTGAASIGTGDTFLGTIMPAASAASTLGANTTLLGGRVFSNSAVTLDTNTITIPTP
jgi:hypothetical protein